MNDKKLAAAIVGTGACLPEKVVTNADLEKMVDTSDEWIFSRTGIRERRIVADGQLTSDLGASACRQVNSRLSRTERSSARHFSKQVVL